jgi:hypothetical protein
MTGKIVKLGVALVVAAAAFSAVAVQAVDSPETLAKRKFERLVQQRQNKERKAQEVNRHWVMTRHIDGGNNSLNLDFDASSFRDNEQPRTGKMSSAGGPPPADSPGDWFASTSYEYQHNYTQGYQVGRKSGSNFVHFVWMHWDRVPQDIEDNDRYVSYAAYNLTNSAFVGVFNGTPITTPASASRGGYINMAVTQDGRCQASFHQRETAALPYEPNHVFFQINGLSLPTTEALTGYAAAGCSEVLWPRNASSRDGVTYSGVRHEIAHSNSNPDPGCDPLLWYWRHNGAAWTGPVVIDSGDAISYALADNPAGAHVAVAVHASNWASMNGVNNVCYYESTTDGAGWITGAEAKTKTNLSNYGVIGGPGAWLHITTAYNSVGDLQIVWDEQREENLVSDCALRHWSKTRGTIRPITFAYYETPFLTGVFNINLAKITMGFGDGSTTCAGNPNTNYVYVVYTKFGGATALEAEDVSAGGYYNGELYLSTSNSGGNTWAPPVNLTNTKTPGCNPGPADTLTGEPQFPDSVCRSEHWATIGLEVRDIDIILFGDLDAGGIPQAEGTWQLNPVHYLRIPGGTANALHVCPVIAANYVATLTSALECEYHAPQAGSNVETFTLINLGNATMSGTISVTDFPDAASLTLSGGVGAYSIPAGSADIVKTVTMASNGAPEGLKQGLISVTHNDAAQASPQTYPISFFVFNEFFCPEDEVIKTGVASPGSLALEVETNGRFGSQNATGGLWRFNDSSATVFDGSILAAHGTQGADTTVFLRFFDRETNGQFGWRAQGDLVVDTSAYGSNAGYACATAHMSTRDSIVGVQVEWIFPQDQSADEVVFARYKFYRHNQATAVSNLAIGMLIDADQTIAAYLGNMQTGVTNRPGSDGTRNLVWAGGVDTVGHVPSGNLTAARFRGGVAVPGGFEGAIVGNNVQDIQPGGGPTDGFLYSAMQNLAGIDLYSVADTDLYIMLALDKGRSIAANETLTYTLIFAADSVSEASLKAKVDAAAAIAGTVGCSSCSCPCKRDPNCDAIITDVLDVISVVNVAFRGTAATQDGGCLKSRQDLNCDGAPDVLDVVAVVNVSFRGTNALTALCDPCL